MDPSKRDDPPAPSFTPTPSKTPEPSPDIRAWQDRVSNPSLVATPVPESSSGFSSPSLLSPLDASARSVATPVYTTPRRTTSSSSLRDDRRRSTPSLKKRSSAASLKSNHQNTGDPTSPHRSLSRRSSTFATSPTAAPTDDPNDYAMSLKKDTSPSAASVAAGYLQSEVDLHQSTDLQSQTLVIVHDACYGHRFSRPRASRAALNSIVERPERILASVLGVSAAYIRLSHRYSGGRFAPRPDLDPRQLPVPPFQIRKTARTMALTSPAVTHVHGSKWMEDLKLMCDAAESRLALNERELARPPNTNNDTSATKSQPLHEGDLYLCSESRDAFEGALGGVCEGVDAVLGPNSTKRAFVCIRPPGHHCSSGYPSGFCWVNNVHVGISYAAMAHGLTHAAIIDFDLHHGDGSQEITWEQNQNAMAAPRNASNHRKAMIGYFSLHDINSYPCEMGDPDKVRNASVCIDKAHGQSIWNVHLEPWKTDSEFWELYTARYTILLEKARAFLRLHTERLATAPNGPRPKAAIFISAGFDASEWEGAGMQRHKVNVPTDFYAKFTRDVVRMAEEEGLGSEGRVISVLEGGYSNRALTSGVFSHLSGLKYSNQNPVTSDDRHIDRLAAEMTDRLGLYETPPLSSAEAAYNSEWWSPSSLEELEALVYPPTVPSKSTKSAPTYFASTQSFTAKVVTPPRDRKSTGSQASFDLEASLPPITWATATHELSKILIPTYRQTTSCRPEDLKAEASRLRRERQTATDGARSASAASEHNRMKLRVRKPKPSLPSTPKAETPKRQVAKNNRRTTIDPATDLPDTTVPKSPATRSTRRKSATSTTTSTSTPEPDASQSSDRPHSQSSPHIPSSANVCSNAAPSVRKPSSSRSGTPKRSASPRKVPPVPRVPAAFLPSAHTNQENIFSEDSRSYEGDMAEKAHDDLDSLTAGVRKLNIKLKVPSPEEHVAREKKMAQSQRRRSGKGSSMSPKSPTKSPAKSSAPKKSRASPTKTASRSLFTPSHTEAPSDHPSSGTAEPKGTSIHGLQTVPFDRYTTDPTTLPSTVEPTGIQWADISQFPKHEEVSAPSSLGIPSARMGIFPPLTPGTVQDVNEPQQSTLYSPPVSAVPTRHGLPVFTSNSPIPFAPTDTDTAGEQRSSESHPWSGLDHRFLGQSEDVNQGGQ
ncbi:hypothetical protein FE257_002125 [Aspergillus nanangensis]|uniref:Histone deacetylase domain-containing protein n=1 Tax=Aspergillus nanangensis TaxID=2582783 RepID=A0AAD4GY80_ASPNN|nr:hypothetical protein FE257_002125 [Aspergillus nanangensis]